MNERLFLQQLREVGLRMQAGMELAHAKEDVALIDRFDMVTGAQLKLQVKPTRFRESGHPIVYLISIDAVPKHPKLQGLFGVAGKPDDIADIVVNIASTILKRIA